MHYSRIILRIPVAITTVGYGEITPRSFLGRLITLPILRFWLAPHHPSEFRPRP
jgi:hypothetical protein